MTVIALGSRMSVSRSTPRTMLQDLQRVLHDGRAEPEALPGLVELRGERPVHVEVAGLDRQVVGFDGSPTLLVDDVERADEPDVLLEVREGAGAPAAIQVVGERRTTDRPEHQVPAAEHDVSAPDSAHGA